MKKRLRRPDEGRLQWERKSVKLFADEEAIETPKGIAARSNSLKAVKLFADEEAIETFLFRRCCGDLPQTVKLFADEEARREEA